LPALGKAATALMTIADQVGIDGVTQPADNLHALILGSDGSTLAAALARVVRLGNYTLISMWKIQDKHNIGS
jgi:hypothetical protein|tara:strand:- start:117 stop:332 length:216 start_codon:yes stop_codon:yes gene_type:complete